MNRILSNVKSKTLLPIAVAMALTSCLSNQGKINKATEQLNSVNDKIENVTAIRDYKVRKAASKDTLSLFNDLENLKKSSNDLVFGAMTGYINRIYKNHKLKDYFTDEEIKQIASFDFLQTKQYFLSTAEFAQKLDLKIDGNTPMYYLWRVENFDENKTKKFSTPFKKNALEFGSIEFLDPKVKQKLSELMKLALELDVIEAHTNMYVDTERKFNAEYMPLKKKYDALRWGVDSGDIKGKQRYKARVDMSDQKDKMQRIFDKYYIATDDDPEKPRIMVDFDEQNRTSTPEAELLNQQLDMIGLLNFTLPEFIAIRPILVRNAKEAQRLKTIKDSIDAEYAPVLNPLVAKRDSLQNIITKLQSKQR